MKYNLEKEIKQQMERYETDTEETSIIFEYPDPAKTEFDLDNEKGLTILEEELHLLCYLSFKIYLENYIPFILAYNYFFEKVKEIKKPVSYVMELSLYNAEKDKIKIKKNELCWTYARASFPVLERKNLCCQCIVELYGDKNGELHEACYLEQYNKKDISALNGVCPTKRLPLPNGEVWYDANFGQFEL